MSWFGDLLDLLLGPPPGGPKVDRVSIQLQESDMATVVEGSTLPFTVVGLNKKGNQVPLTAPATVSVADSALASATVDPDGKNGVLTGLAEGTTTLNAASGSLVDSKPVTVTPDLVPVTIQVVFGSPV